MMRTGLRLLSSLAVVLAAAVMAAAEGAPARPAPYDTTVMVVDTGGGGCEVAVAYDRVVDHAALTAGVNGLARATGASISELSLKEETLVRGEPGVGTSAGFRAMGLVRSGAPLPVAALVTAFPAWGHLRIAFFVGPGFRFAGPPGGEAAGVRFLLAGSSNGYQYDVVRADRGVAPGSERGSPGAGGREARVLGSGIRKVLLGTSAVLLAVAGWVLWQCRRRGPGRSQG